MESSGGKLVLLKMFVRETGMLNSGRGDETLLSILCKLKIGIANVKKFNYEQAIFGYSWIVWYSRDVKPQKK